MYFMERLPSSCTLDSAVDRSHRLGGFMHTEISPPACFHPLGENATQPIESHYGTLATLLLLVGISPLRRHALPAHRIAAHSSASN